MKPSLALSLYPLHHHWRSVGITYSCVGIGQLCIYLCLQMFINVFANVYIFVYAFCISVYVTVHICMRNCAYLRICVFICVYLHAQQSSEIRAVVILHVLSSTILQLLYVHQHVIHVLTLTGKTIEMQYCFHIFVCHPVHFFWSLAIGQMSEVNKK